ncbi:hypothetical protein L7F22_067696 [Adiantum nelumboides]|nr:hypothetical protein [Adiantum nelumboides]
MLAASVVSLLDCWNETVAFVDEERGWQQHAGLPIMSRGLFKVNSMLVCIWKELGRKLIKDELKVELDTQHFNAQLALSSASNKVSILFIFELFESALYPEYKIADLFGSKLSFENPVTIGFVVVNVDNFVKSDGESAYRLVIADGSNSSDKAMLLFVPSRHQEYHHIVSNLQERSFYTWHTIQISSVQKAILSQLWMQLSCVIFLQIYKHIFKMFWESSLLSKVMGKRSLAVRKL